MHGLSPVRRQTIDWTSADNGQLHPRDQTSLEFKQNVTFSFSKMHAKFWYWFSIDLRRWHQPWEIYCFHPDLVSVMKTAWHGYRLRITGPFWEPAIRGFNVPFHVSKSKLLKNSRVAGDLRRPDVHVTSLQCNVITNCCSCVSTLHNAPHKELASTRYVWCCILNDTNSKQNPINNHRNGKQFTLVSDSMCANECHNKSTLRVQFAK